MSTHDNEELLAFVIDNKVVHVLSTDAKLAAVLLSNPVVLDVKDLPYDQVGDATYDAKKGTLTPANPDFPVINLKG